VLHEGHSARKILFVCQELDYPPLTYDRPVRNLNLKVVFAGMAAVFDACYVSPEQAREHSFAGFASPAAVAGLPPALIIQAGRDSLHNRAEL
jgi:hypothetical protein